jgi:hypothetical protein
MPKIIHLNNIENVSNKTNSISINSTTEQYPSAKAVYDALAGMGIVDVSDIREWSTLDALVQEYNQNVLYRFSFNTDFPFKHESIYLDEDIYLGIPLMLSDGKVAIRLFSLTNDYQLLYSGNESLEVVRITHPFMDLGTIDKASNLTEMPIFGNITYAFKKNGETDFSPGNYLGRVSVDSPDIFEVTPFIYKGKSYEINTYTGEVTEVSMTD